MSEIPQSFPLDSEKIYYSTDDLTLDTPEGPKTLRVGAWLNEDPVRIHKMIVREKVLRVDQIEVYNPLMSKLRRADRRYLSKTTLWASTSGGAKASTRIRCICPNLTRSVCSRRSS